MKSSPYTTWVNYHPKLSTEGYYCRVGVYVEIAAVKITEWLTIRFRFGSIHRF